MLLLVFNNMEKLKIVIWTILHFPKFQFHYWRTRKGREKLKIFTSIETIDYILKTGCSVSRFGDGELQMLSHYLRNGTKEDFLVDTFQYYDYRLALRLKEVFQNTSLSLLVCLPYQFKESRISKLKARVFWEREWLGRFKDLRKLGIDKQFGDTNFTRFYMNRKDIIDYSKYIAQLKKIWTDKPIVVVEGEFSRLGVENDFFNNARSIDRIICPAKNAFERYEEILFSIQELEKNKMILIALGQTATILAYDLSKRGYQAIDVGHVDIEYEWYRIGAIEKVAVRNKYVNEVPAGRIDTKYINKVYEEQIISRIG